MAVETIQPSIDFKINRTPKLPNKDLLSEQSATRLFFLTFPVSQGDPELQKNISKEIAALHPAWHIDKDLKEQIVINTYSRAENFLRHNRNNHNFSENNSSYMKDPSLFPTVIIQEEVISRFNDFEQAINGERQEFGSNFPEIAEQLIKRDYEFIVKREAGRPRINPDVTKRQTDPYFSYTCLAITMSTEAEAGMTPLDSGRTLHAPELDHIFIGVGNLLRKNGVRLDRETDAQFDRVWQKYNATHPHNPLKW